MIISDLHLELVKSTSSSVHGILSYYIFICGTYNRQAIVKGVAPAGVHYKHEEVSLL